MQKNETDLTLGLGSWLSKLLHIRADWEIYVKLIVILVAVALIGYLIWLVTNKLVVRAIHATFTRTKATWDDKLVHRRVLSKLAYVVPVIFFETLIPTIFADFQWLIPKLTKISGILILSIFLWSANAFLSAVGDILSTYKSLKDKPIASYTQVLRIILFLVVFVLIFSILLGKSPIFFLGAMGAMGAVILLIFKDTILGFVASIQISVYDIVREGDWIAMPKFDADGDVIAINLNTVKVQNWDMTITTIPTYALVSESFKNWRGMSESGGRRIKRSMRLKMSSVKFCTPELIERFKSIQLLSGYLNTSLNDIHAFNRENNIDTSIRVNGRHLTNLGVFRIYIELYIKSLPTINQQMIAMVRQLQPDEKGIPLELYCFSKSKEWITYERVMADIFDHLLASVAMFDLCVFEYPSSNEEAKATPFDM